MNPTKILLTLLISFLPLSLTAGDLDGKAIVCVKLVLRELPTNEPGIWGFIFGNASVAKTHQLVIEGDIVRIREPTTEQLEKEYWIDSSAFSESQKNIRWGKRWILDRETLLLTYMFAPPTYQCEVPNNVDEYFRTLENYRDDYQRAVDTFQTKNKI